LDISFMMVFFIRNASDVETSIVSVERILEYMSCPQEADWMDDKRTGTEEKDAKKSAEMKSQIAPSPPKSWPTAGSVQFRNFSCRYRAELPLTLRSISAEIRPLEKVGVVGRTGAGKTSMAMALFRIVDATEGCILIDGVDIATVSLYDLRSRITIIPQDPVLFSGTLRFNLDPFDAYDDARLWAALEHAHLKEFVETQPDRLYHRVSENGENISVGQRQLLCLARAILRRSQLVVLDEATASIDVATDTLIQQTIRSEFIVSTVITIAHRISTVLDYDRIMVLKQGKLVEFDTPKTLLEDRRSLFYELATTDNTASSSSNT